MANTTGITDKIERKKVKRAARKKAAPKAPRTGARGAWVAAEFSCTQPAGRR